LLADLLKLNTSAATAALMVSTQKIICPENYLPRKLSAQKITYSENCLPRRLPTQKITCGFIEKLVEPRGLEPLTSTLPVYTDLKVLFGIQ